MSRAWPRCVNPPPWLRLAPLVFRSGSIAAWAQQARAALPARTRPGRPLVVLSAHPGRWEGALDVLRELQKTRPIEAEAFFDSTATEHHQKVGVFAADVLPLATGSVQPSSEPLSVQISRATGPAAPADGGARVFPVRHLDVAADAEEMTLGALGQATSMSRKWRVGERMTRFAPSAGGIVCWAADMDYLDLLEPQSSVTAYEGHYFVKSTDSFDRFRVLRRRPYGVIGVLHASGKACLRMAEVLADANGEEFFGPKTGGSVFDIEVTGPHPGFGNDPGAFAATLIKTPLWAPSDADVTVVLDDVAEAPRCLQEVEQAMLAATSCCLWANPRLAYEMLSITGLTSSMVLEETEGVEHVRAALTWGKLGGIKAYLKRSPAVDPVADVNPEADRGQPWALR